MDYMITVAHMDLSCRIRDTKEILAMFHTYPKGIRYIMFTTGKRPGNKIKVPWLPIYKLGKHDRVNEIRRICKKEHVDIFHPHNVPVPRVLDGFGIIGKKLRNKTGIPFVFNVHDAGYDHIPVNVRKVSAEVYHSADKLITVGKMMSEFLVDAYGVDPKKCFELYSLPNRKFLPDIKPMSGCYNRCVYEGGVKPHITKDYFNHRYYADIFHRLVKQGISVNVYPTKNANWRYPVPGVRFMPKVSGIDNLYKTLAGYDFGFSGFYNSGGPFLDFAMPNKLFEYVGSGIPVLAMDYKSIGDWVRKNQFGVVIDKNTLKLPPGWKGTMIKAKQNVMKNRGMFTMEKQMKGLLKMYQGML